MAQLTPGMKQDWKQRSAYGGRPMKRVVRLTLVGLAFGVLLALLIWFLLPPPPQRTFFFAANPIQYDLWAATPLVHSSVTETIAEPGNHDPKSFFISKVGLEESLPPLDLLAKKASGGIVPGPYDACIFYLEAHTLRYDADGESHVVVATPTFLRNSLADWQHHGVLDLNVVLDWIQTANCPTKLVLLDAGTITTDGRIDLYENNFTSALEVEMKQRSDSDLFLITSHENGQKSLSLSLQSNSIFSQAVQEALIGQYLIDQTDDDHLTLDELYHHICVRVKNHLGDGVIAQTPRLFQGGAGILTKDFPPAFVCRYVKANPLESEIAKKAEQKAEQEAKKKIPPPPKKQPAADPKGKADTKPDKEDPKTSTSDEEKDPRWVTLNEVWQLRDQLAQPPAERQGMIWSPIDFAPQYFRRLDSYLVGYQFRLLFDSGTVPEDRLAKMKDSLTILIAHMRTDQRIRAIPQISDTPADNLIEAWNQFVDTPRQVAWSADLTPQGSQARDAILGWNYCVYQIPQVNRQFEYTGSNSTLASYESLLRDVNEVTLGMLQLAPLSENQNELNGFPYADVVSRSLTDLEALRRLTGAQMSISPRNAESSNLNEQMADALRLIGYLKTSLPSAADRQRMTQTLRTFSQQPVPDTTFIDSSKPFLPQLAQGPLPRASEASMKRLRSLSVDIASAGSPPTTSRNNPFVLLGRTVPSSMPDNTDYTAQVRYQLLVRMLDWRAMSQIVGEVPQLPFRFPIQEKIPQLMVQADDQSQSVTLYEVGKPVPFTLALTATNFPPSQVEFTIDYDREALEISFKNGSFDPVTGILSYNIDSSGPVNIEGAVTAKLDREANAARQHIADVRAAQNEHVSFTIPVRYIPPGAEMSDMGKLDVSLPWAEEIDLVVQQTSAAEPGIFYGDRVQIPLFDNRESEFQFGVLNRSRTPRKLSVSIYPVIRPSGSVMPLGRIFSDQYHRKSPSGGPNSQAAERAPWQVASYGRPTVQLGPAFLPLAIATGIDAPPVDQIPPPATQLRGRIINEEIDASQCQWLKFTGPPGPPGADGKPGPPGKVAATDLTSGMLVVIEDLVNKDADNQPIRWMRWVEWTPRQPREYLDFQPAVYPTDNLTKLEMIFALIRGKQNLPTSSWDEFPLAGFSGLPQNLAKVPIQIQWDWQWQETFAGSELIQRQAFGTISSPTETAMLGAILNLDADKTSLRPLLIDVASNPKLPTLKRAFREVMQLKTGKVNADASAGFAVLRLNSYVAHVKGEQKPPPPVEIMASSWPADKLPIILPSDVDTVDWQMAISTDTNSFNGASEINPDKIQLGLLEIGNRFESARPDFTETIYSNRSFSAELVQAQAEGPLVFSCTLEDVVAKGLNARTFETFVGNYVVDIYNGPKLVNHLQIPVVIDKDPPTIQIDPSPLTIPINDGVKLTIPTEDKASGVSQLEYGVPGPGETIVKPAILEPLVGNIVADPNDSFHRHPQFILNIRPEQLKWEEGTTQKLRVRAVNRANLKSAPLDLIIRVGPKTADPKDVDPMPLMVIRAQVVYVNDKVAKDPQYKPKIKELPLQPTLAPDGMTWVFESTELKPNTNYTLESSGLQTSGGIKSTKTTAQASPANERSPIYKLKFD
ncbi:hypothetical protein GC197_15640 [bacterium]|nr:hypothetical protein [bacterium]